MYPRDASFLRGGGASMSAYAYHAAATNEDGEPSCLAACSKRIMVLNSRSNDQGVDVTDLEVDEVCQRKACLGRYQKARIFARARIPG